MRYVFNICLLLVLIAHQTLGQKRQGYIDFDKVVVIFPQYLVEQRKIETRVKELNDSVKLLYEKFQSQARAHYPQIAMTDSVFLKARVDELYELQRKLQEFHGKTKDKLKELQEKSDLSMKRIVVAELKKFSVDNNVLCVLGKKSILYCNDCSDLSE